MVVVRISEICSGEVVLTVVLLRVKEMGRPTKPRYHVELDPAPI